MKNQLTTLLPMLRRFAFSLTGSVADADDIVQITIEKILSRGMPEDVELSKWAFKVCRNVWIDEYRARKVRLAATQNPELQEEACTDNEENIAAKETLAQVNIAMQTLPNDQRSILSLVAVQGLSYKEVAETLDVPVGTVMSRLSRARTSLLTIVKSQQGGLFA
ncbi:MAG: RNA polymerase sigma factor [Paraglaciecola sp.]|uniref:RNA polymerase sigma factor n=1 Tax=Pseudomonadati TaxID=3379134 RepID=UPI00273E9CC7|nr:RNA polymerase sigma factor [Paraglaciecola sp.]MDP5031866.1 RNA polymerase sigma factor [Paraglaciecola sp.]MDP5039798.1 RNA polymerase sigma factor [Paraglaciecola sp.]MDP5133525.1 RNA polymerase sigma factor [Paraglaciecola sp.]